MTPSPMDLRWTGDAEPWVESHVEVDGARIECLVWGPEGAPALVFMHGMMAHARWWRFVAPHFAKRCRCVAFSFSGMGRSEWRERYSIAGYVRETEAAMAFAGIGPGDAILVAHSFGSVPARRLAERKGAGLRGLLIVDGKVLPTHDYTPSPPRQRPPRVYPSEEEAIRAFRLMPNDSHGDRRVLRYVASRGLRRIGTGLTWAFDPELRKKFDYGAGDYHVGLDRMDCRLGFIWGEHSRLFDRDTRALIEDRYPDCPRHEVPGAGHHVLLDRPGALSDHLQDIVERWT